jgi:ABC-2 type transport system permease protein
MNNLVRAELLKLRTTRTFCWSVVAALAFVPLSIALAIAKIGTPDGTSLDSAEGFRNVIAAASSGGVLVLLIGVVLVASEFRFDTVTSTFLITPRRKDVVRAKLVAAGLVGLGIALASSLLTIAIALPWLESRHVGVASHSSDIAIVLLGGIGATVVSGMVGVGIGALMTNQTLAVTVTLIWSLLVEGMVVNFAPGLGRWLPGGAAGAMSGAATYSHLLPVWAAALVFAGYGAAFAAAGSRFVIRRDIT